MISAADCPTVDNGHIVPRTYQRAWEVEGRQVAVHQPGRSGCEVKSSKLVGVRGPYYRRTRPRHGTQTDDIEASLGYVENKATPALRQIVAGQPFTVERKGALAQLFGLQMMRGPAFFEKHEEIQRSVLEGAKASDLKPRHLAAVGGDVDLARSQVIEVLLSPTSRFMTMLSYATKVAGILSLMRWHVVRFDGPLLAYSDHPVVLWPMNVERTRPFSRQGLGPLTMLEIRVPIAPDAAVLMNWIDRSDEVGVPMKPRAAAELNAFILALYVAGHKRPEIADRLGLTQRQVKRELLEIMDEARAVLAGLVGGGCQHGEPLMVRFVCGLSTSAEEAYAREHLASCGRCEIFCERLLAWRDKAGVMLPVPAVEETSPGLIERTMHKAAEGMSSLKHHIVDGGAQAKQQAAASSYRAVDPTPLAVARPGTVATAVATCILAIGGGATYCVEQGVNPLGAARGLIASASEGEPEPAATAPEPESTGPVYTPVEPSPESEEAPVSESTPPPAEEKPEAKPEPPPPKEDSFEPVSPAYASSEGEAEATESYEASEPAPVESTGRPAPVAASAPPEFGGP